MRLLLVLAGALTLSAPAFASETVTYTYDAHGRVIKVVHSGSVNNGVTTDYTYDDAGNRIEKKTTGA
ncbi:RHS repeat domain-containing protein [uncultured Maricaulis sp.]|uniref:RHS repeat domain-containing protein n=1 Tax=uncultured Maricaulis sp. TaxID=174710 RepID=UPI0030D8EDA2|tara:strand:+ start:67078 stop:67278 length:201 start_codon:yes stop_codon:yes gene_type:complete